jgi:DNA polymerase III epsilon subunit-like protein
MLPQPLIFLDLETTGMMATQDRITEIGLVERHGLSCSARHRALGDAEVLWQFLQKLYAELDTARIDAAVQAQMGVPSLPAGLSAEVLEAIPEAPVPG